jgi:hypothetical protein
MFGAGKQPDSGCTVAAAVAHASGGQTSRTVRRLSFTGSYIHKQLSSTFSLLSYCWAGSGTLAART